MSLAFTRDGTRIVGAAVPTARTSGMSPRASIIESYRDGAHARGAGDIVLDRRGLVLDANYDGSLRAWDPDGARRVGRRVPLGPGGSAAAAGTLRGDRSARRRDGGELAATGPSRWSTCAPSGPSRVLPARNGNFAEPMAFTSDGRRLVTGGIAGTVTIWDVRSRAVVRRLRFPGPVAAVAVSPDGRLLAVQREAEASAGLARGGARPAIGEDGHARTGSASAWARRRGPAGVHGRRSRPRRLRTAATADRRAVGWDARSGAQLIRHVPRARAFAIVARRPDDRRRHRRRPRDLLRRPHRRPRGAGDQGGRLRAIAQLAFSPDGRLLAVAAWDGTATVWDIRSRTRVGDAFPSRRALVPGGGVRPQRPAADHRARQRGRVAARPPDPAALRLPGRRPRPDPRGVARRSCRTVRIGRCARRPARVRATSATGNALGLRAGTLAVHDLRNRLRTRRARRPDNRSPVPLFDVASGRSTEHRRGAIRGAN